MERDEGYVKFNLDWTFGAPPPVALLKRINRWRRNFYSLGLIGVYPDGIGYGNISVKARGGPGFIITGTRTGGVPVLDESHYTLVSQYDVSRNHVVCVGPAAASSESMTHATIYELDPGVGAVIHVHHRKFWERSLGRLPTTDPDVPYGTPEMAREVRRLFETGELRTKKILAMGGHEDGIISFGADLNEAGGILLDYF